MFMFFDDDDDKSTTADSHSEKSSGNQGGDGESLDGDGKDKKSSGGGLAAGIGNTILYPLSFFDGRSNTESTSDKESNNDNKVGTEEWRRRGIEWEMAMCTLQQKEEEENGGDSSISISSSSSSITTGSSNGAGGSHFKKTYNGRRSEPAGTSIPLVPKGKDCASQIPKSYSYADSKIFNCRIGPNYNRNGKKAPSGPALYELVGADWFQMGSKVDDIGGKVCIPPEWLDIDTHHELIPPIFIVNIQVPSENPLLTSLFTEVTDGAGYSFVTYYRITKETAAAMADLSTAPPAVKLFADYCMEAPEIDKDNNSPWRGRFKAIVKCENIEDYTLPGLITQYNAKPVLIKTTGSLYRGKGYVEMDINGHKFGAVAKTAFQTLLPHFDSFVNSIAFCIESRTDEEMPETILGCCQWNKPGLDNVVPWDS